MDISSLKSLELKDLKAQYQAYLETRKFKQPTIQTSLTSAFYIWNHRNQFIFWDIVTSPNFEQDARNLLKQIFIENNVKNPISQISSYMTHIRRFRTYLEIAKDVKPVLPIKQSTKDLSKPKREIIINKMYAGGYLTEGDNIGHEIINLFKADDGNNYIYLNSQGTIDMTHAKNELTILLVRKFAPRIYKVLAKATGIKTLEFADANMPRHIRYQRQLELGLTYGGVSLDDLFDQNSFRGSLDEAKNVCTTFIVSEVIQPIEPLYLTDDESLSESNIFFIRTNNGFGKQTLREFHDEVNKPDSFNDLNAVIENDILWEGMNTTRRIESIDKITSDSNFNFLKIIKQEDNELVYSNMFAYFFNLHKEIFCEFAKTVLNIKIEIDFIIEREKNNIDLLIQDDYNVIVIENKIKAGINGVNARHHFYGEQIQSQLNKYYRYITTSKEYSNKQSKFFIFTPNYNRIDLSKFINGERYTIIYYSDIYDFYKQRAHQFNDLYFNDFLKSLIKHTKAYDNELEEEMFRRFQNTISSVKNRH